MKTNRTLLSLLFSSLLITALITSGAPHAQASDTTPEATLGSAFTYQGRLTNNGSPANGQYDFRFSVFDALSGGNELAGPITYSNQTVSNGLVTISVDFGADPFYGAARYLGISVAPAGGSYTVLSPRQPLTPAPYALTLRPGANILGSSGSPILSATNQNANGVAFYGYAQSGTTSKAISGESLNGYGGYFISSTGIGVSASGADGINSTGTATGGNGVKGTANNGTNARGVSGISSSGSGVYGTSTNGIGVSGSSTNGFAGNFVSTSATGVNVSGSNGLYSIGGQDNGVGLWGVANVGNDSKGVYGTSTSGYGVYGRTSVSNRGGVYGTSTGTNGIGLNGVANTGALAIGVYGSSSSGTGTYGVSTASNGTGVYGESNSGTNAKGVYGSSTSGSGGYFESSTGEGVFATGALGVYGAGDLSNGSGIWGEANEGDHPIGVYGTSIATHGKGIEGNGYGYGIYGTTVSGTGFAGYFLGDVSVSGSCCAAGESYNRIDNPLDPANSYLNQSLIQSPDMLSLIDGNAHLDSKGEAVVSLPDWFAASNTNFRYSLTAVGAPGPNLYISQEIAGSTFHIAGGTPNGKVSWKITGIRTDPYAVNHPIQVEQTKPAEDAGKYLYPEDYSQPDSNKLDSTLAKPYAKP